MNYWEKYKEKGYDPERLRKEYEAWEKKAKFVNEDKEELIHDVTKDLTFLSSLSVEQYTLLRKWREIQEFKVKRSVKTVLPLNDFFGKPEKEMLSLADLNLIKSRMWSPESPDDYLKLEPRLQICNGHKDNLKTWGLLRSFTSTMLNNSIPGRNIRFIAYDAVTSKYLGVICISSDFMDLTARDKKIGWSREVKTAGKMINHIGIGSTIVPTQPLGYNFVGGKLLALLILSDYSEDAWTTHEEIKHINVRKSELQKARMLAYGNVDIKKEKDIKYDRLVGVTTTSLYGSFSQYNGLKYWKKAGRSAGSIKYEPSRDIVNRCKEWLKWNHRIMYWEWYEAKSNTGHPFKRDFKQRSLAWIYKEFGISKEIIQADHERGIYFCTLFNKTNEYLRKEITEDELIAGGKRFDNSIEAIGELWKTKYASKRVKRLLELGNYNTESLFYDELIYLDSWEEVNEKYIKNVGR